MGPFCPWASGSSSASLALSQACLLCRKGHEGDAGAVSARDYSEKDRLEKSVAERTQRSSTWVS